MVFGWNIRASANPTTLCGALLSAPRADLLKIVTKYILKEHFSPLIFSLSALTSLLLLNYVAKRLGELVGKGLPWNVIAEFMLLSVPFTIAMTLPMAILVATLHAFSRMASENEITAFKASGMSLQRLMVPVILSGMVLAVGMVVFNDQVLPRANLELTALTNDIARKKPTFALKEQVINEVSPAKLFLRAGRLLSSNRMRDVTIYDITNPQARRTIRADSGMLALTDNGSDLKLTLFDGNMTEISVLDQTRLQRLFFHTDVVIVRGIGNTLEHNNPTAGEKGDREMTVCELQSRVRLTSTERDNAYAHLRQLEPSRKHPPQPKVPKGSGNAYCAFKAALSRLSFVRAARAEEPQQPVPQRQVPKPQVPQQAPVPMPMPAATPMIAPPSLSDPGPSSVLAEGVRSQVGQLQSTIDGDQVEIEKKFAIAAACVIFVLLGAPIALRFPRGGVGLTLGVSLGVFALYYVGLIAGEALARGAYMSPFLAMWLANFIFLAVGIALTVRLGREGATSRGSETSERLARLRERITFWRRRTA